MSDHQQHLPDPLYCEEDYSEECPQEDDEETSSSTRPPLLMDHDLLWEDDELSSLFSKEELNHLCHFTNLEETNPQLDWARRGAVEWILKVTAHHSFSALTAVLAVNYLDRFLFSFQFQREKPWLIQLASVACLSLAAKVEETHVPLLLDLQVEEAEYAFEAKTIQRMEVLVLSTLKWKMNPVTPLSFLDYIIRRLGFKDHLLCWEFLTRCECLILSLVSECKFMSYLPSIIATATMLQVIKSIEPSIELEYHNQLLGILEIDKGKVEDCQKMIREYSRPGWPNKRKFGSVPGSPKGVMDVSFSSESSNDSWGSSSSPEPPSNKRRLDP